MKKIKHYQPSNEEIGLLAITKRCALFCLIFFIMSMLLLFILSLTFVNFADSTTYLNLIGKLTLYLSSFLCSFLLSKRIRENYIYSGILLGALITSLIFILSLMYPESTTNSVIWLLLIPVSTLLGSLLGKKRNIKKHKHRVRRK